MIAQMMTPMIIQMMTQMMTMIFFSCRRKESPTSKSHEAMIRGFHGGGFEVESLASDVTPAHYGQHGDDDDDDDDDDDVDDDDVDDNDDDNDDVVDDDDADDDDDDGDDDDDCYYHDEKDGIDHGGDHNVQKYFQSFNSMTNASCK